MTDWMFLFLAGVFEMGFTTALKLTYGFTRFWPTCFFIAFAIASFCCLNKSLNSIPLGMAYAIWTGIGASGTLIISIFFFEEAITAPRLMFLMLLIASIAGLKLAP